MAARKRSSGSKNPQKKPPKGGRQPAKRKPRRPGSKGLPAHLTPGNPGNSGGKKGRSGRPSNEFRTWCREVIDDERTRNAAKMKLALPFDAGWASAFKAVAAYGYGLPDQKLDITTNELRGRVRATAELLARELPAELLDRIEPQLAAIWDGADATAELEEAGASNSAENDDTPPDPA